MTKKISLKRNFVLNLIVQILNVVVPLITAPYLARILHEEGNGIYSYSYSIVTYFTLFANLGLTIYGQREISRSREDADKINRLFTELVLLRIITSILSSIVLFSICFSIGWGEDYNFVITILGIQVIGSLFDISFFFQGIEDFKSIAIRQIILKLMTIILVFVFVKHEDDVWIYALCIAGSTVGANILMWPSVFRKVKFVKISIKDLKRHLMPSFLIFLPTLAITVYSVFDKTMIGLLSSNPKYDNGCYEQSYKINSAALVLVSVISPILVPRNTYDYSVGNIDSFNKHINFAIHYVFLISLPMIFGFVVLSKNLSSWFLGEGYDSVPLMLQIMSLRFLFAGFTLIFSDQIFIAIGKEKISLIATIFGALINLVLNYFFIKEWGAIGAAITTSVSEFVVMFVLLIFALKYNFVCIKNIFIASWKYLFAASLMFISIYLLQKYCFGYSIIDFLILLLIGSSIYGIILIILREKIIITLIKKIFGFIYIKKKS